MDCRINIYGVDLKKIKKCRIKGGFIMSNKEIAISLLEQIPDYKMGYIVSFLKGFQMDDEIEDDLFCMK